MYDHPFPRPDAPPVLIVSGCHGATRRYRCFHHLEQLQLRGVPSMVIPQWRNHLLDAGLGCGTVVLHRVAMDEAVDGLIAQTRDGGGVVLFDIDDLVFDPEATGWHHGLTLLSPEEQERYHDGVRRYRQTLEACDGAVVATSFLARQIEALGLPAWVSRNCVDLEILALSERAAAAQDRSDRERVVVGYASGSRTHDRDFAAAAGPGLLRVMARHDHVVLRVIGDLELGPEWDRLADRVERVPAVDWRALPSLIAGFDISLAPLEIDNPFCQAKSELKWLEAAACGVASVASATEAFAAAVVDGETGLLAGGAADWEEALDVLIAGPERRARVARSAFDEVRARRTTAAQAAAYERTLGMARDLVFPSRVAPPPPVEEADGLRINVLVPEPVRGSGGHTTLMRMMGGLAGGGHRVTLHVDRGPLFREATDDELAEFMDQHFPRADVAFRLGRDFEPADALMATSWGTAAAVAYAPNVRSKLYFVQDFEPYFEPMGPGYLGAEATYRLGLAHVTIGPWLSELLREQYGAVAEPVDFGVDHDIYRPGPDERPPRLVFYGRATTPRRGTELGLAALRLVKDARPDVEVVLYGGRPDGAVDDGFTQVGVLNHQELAELYRESAAGLALSYTNMSLVPFEMMACGCAVVAVDAPPVRWFLEDGRNSLLARSTAESMAQCLLRLLEDEPLRRAIVDGGHRAVRDLNWERSAAQFEERVRQLVATGGGIRPGWRPAATPRLDALVSGGEDTVSLAGGREVSWHVECGSAGLHRIEARLTRHGRSPRGQLVLTVREHATAADAVARATVAARDVINDAWTSFTFTPLSSPAAGRYHVALAWTGGNDGAELALLVGGESAPAADGTRLGDRPRAGEPDHRAYTSSAPHNVELGRALQPQLHERRRDLAGLRAERARLSRRWWYGILSRWRALVRPMPPPALRPWPEGLPLGTKLARGAARYGVVPVLREIWSYAGWRLGFRRGVDG